MTPERLDEIETAWIKARDYRGYSPLSDWGREEGRELISAHRAAMAEIARLRAALEDAWPEFESAADVHKCASCLDAAEAMAKALAPQP